MDRPRWMLLLLAMLLLGCKSSNYADRGAAVGALTGALTGAAIGERNGDTAAGAILGTAVGALAGSAVGESIDEEVARNNALIEQRLGHQLAGAVTTGDVITLSQAGLSDPVIVTHIQANGVQQPPTPQDLITLGQMGVSDAVIQAMQTTPPPQVVEPPRQVVVEEHHYVPLPFRPPWHYPHVYHGPRHPRKRFHWGISFGN